jgi:hypothetical protein
MTPENLYVLNRDLACFNGGGLSGSEAIGLAADGLDVDRVLRIVFELLPQPGDVHVDRARSDVPAVFPDLPQELFPWHPSRDGLRDSAIARVPCPPGSRACRACATFPRSKSTSISLKRKLRARPFLRARRRAGQNRCRKLFGIFQPGCACCRDIVRRVRLRCRVRPTESSYRAAQRMRPPFRSGEPRSPASGSSLRSGPRRPLLRPHIPPCPCRRDSGLTAPARSARGSNRDPSPEQPFLFAARFAEIAAVPTEPVRPEHRMGALTGSLRNRTLRSDSKSCQSAGQDAGENRAVWRFRLYNCSAPRCGTAIAMRRNRGSCVRFQRTYCAE